MTANEDVERGSIAFCERHWSWLCGAGQGKCQGRLCPEHGIRDCSPLLNGCSWKPRSEPADA